MAVIITNMDMPKNCYDCPCCRQAQTCCEDDICNVLDMELKLFNDVMKRRHEDCPLKSIDGLAYAIEQFPFTYGFASDIEREINKYCNKGNNKE